MKRAARIVMAFLISGAVVAAAAHSQGAQVLFREEFNDLAAWKEVFFPKIPRHTVYAVEKADRGSSLVARSDASASLLVYRKTFDVYEYPDIRWQWKVSAVYAKADPARKEGDDYPIRIYIAFAYDPKTAGPVDRAVYGALRLIYGEYPPAGSLNYVWSSKVTTEKMIKSPYTDRNRMIVKEQGGALVGHWVVEEANIVEDYMAAFRKKPPRRATIGIMNDSDNTGERSTSSVDFIEVYRKPQAPGPG